MQYASRFSESSLRLKSSKIRELFKMADVPGIISMGGGMPDSASFPFDRIKEIIASWRYETAVAALQYGMTKGYGPLLSEIADWMEKKKAVSMNGQDIIVTTGSQQGLSLVSKLFLDKDDVVLIELPSFIGAIASFYSYMGKVEGVRLDDDGIDLEDLERTIKRCNDAGETVKFLYTIPNFNNPSGITLSCERRKALLKIAEKHDILVIEDDPYGDLFYEGGEEEYLPVKSYDSEGRVLYLGTFSKVLSPGLRVGWIVADGEIVSKLELLKQSFDACTPTFSQLIATDYMRLGHINDYIADMRKIYRIRRDRMLLSLERYMPKGVRWTTPRGGFFVWLTLPERFDAEEVFKKSVRHKVAFVTGDAFLPEDSAKNHIRLAFSDLDPERIEQGVMILADVLKEMAG
ncbi:MAG: PLP-dependent aminotransferase family protein [Spirochaetes bacterium]|nr:PLP-dependent aminotransferase family protein [Spirochaetota bacterium]